MRAPSAALAARTRHRVRRQPHRRAELHPRLRTESGGSGVGKHRAVAAGALSASLLLSTGLSGAAAAAGSERSARPDLVVTAVSISAHRVSVGHAVTVRDTTKNRGAGPAAASTIGYYLSTDKSSSRSDKQLGSQRASRLGPGAQTTVKKAVTIPSGTAARSYFVLACADVRKAVPETSEANNCHAVAITVTAPSSHTFPMTPDPLTTVTPTLGHPSSTSGSGAVTPGTSTTLTETLKDGSVASLFVPAGAVSQPLTVRMVPVASVTGAPTSWVSGVSLQPTGLELYRDATLTITPAAGLGNPDTAFRFFDGGADPDMYPIASSSGGSFTLPVSTLATYGVGASTQAQRTTMLAHPPVRIDGQLDNLVAPLAGPAPTPAAAGRSVGVRSPGLAPADDTITNLLQAYSAYYTDVVKPGLTAALGDDTLAGDAISRSLSWAHDLAILGAGDDPQVTESVQLVMQVVKAAVPKENQRCRTEHSLPDLALLLDNARVLAVLGDSAGSQSALDDAIGCGRFTVTWHSDITQDEHVTESVGDVAAFDLSAAFDVGTGSVALALDGSGGFTGQATLHYNSASYHAHWLYTGCGATEDRTLTATHDDPAETVTLRVPYPVSGGPGVAQERATLSLSPFSIYAPPDETYHEAGADPCNGAGQGDEVLPNWQEALKSAGLADPLPLTPLTSAATVFDHTFTFDGTATFGGYGPLSPHEHSDTTVTLVHTPE